MASRLTNCRICGKFFLGSGSDICLECVEKRHQEEESLTAYINAHPGASIDTICRDTGIHETAVRRMMHQGLFQPQPTSLIKYPCTKCGTMIDHGEFCPNCEVKMGKAIILQQQKNRETGFGQKKEPRKHNGFYSHQDTNPRFFGSGRRTPKK